MSLLKGQKLVKKAKIEKNSNATFLVIFKQCDIFFTLKLSKDDNFKGKLLHLNTPILGILFRVEL